MYLEKHPRTPHLPGSPGATPDDIIAASIAPLVGREVLITEKLDGEGTSMTRRLVHARSPDANHHPSQDWVRRLHGQIAYLIPEHLKVVGESVYARHSIFYKALSSFYYCFGMVDLYRRVFLSVDETREWCELLGLEFVPILYRGTFPEKFQLPPHSAFAPEIEGYVVRNVAEFPVSAFPANVMKWVRHGHVQTADDWRVNWIPNQLKR